MPIDELKQFLTQVLSSALRGTTHIELPDGGYRIGHDDQAAWLLNKPDITDSQGRTWEMADIEWKSARMKAVNYIPTS